MFIAKPKLSKLLNTAAARLSSLKVLHIIKNYNKTQLSKPQIIYLASPENLNLLNSISQLNYPYRATAWLDNPHLQLIFLELRKKVGKALQYDKIETLTMADGGHTALAWYGYDLPADTPTIVILHTLTGSPKSMQDMVLDLHQQTGWRVVVAVRRGHANLAFDPPRFNIFGSTSDLKQQLNHIEQLFPASPLYAVGSSAGSGLLIRYLGEEKQNAKFRAAFAFCPGYNIDEGFKYVHPVYSKYMAKKLIDAFVTPHVHSLQKLATFSIFSAAKTLTDFHETAYELSGYTSYEAYSLATNPMRVFDTITCPVMALNAEDDPVCDIRNLQPYAEDIKKMSSVIVVTTQKGSHCAYPQGWRAKSWAHQLMSDYFIAIHRNGNT